jgi:hypothetical protein
MGIGARFDFTCTMDGDFIISDGSDTFRVGGAKVPRAAERDAEKTCCPLVPADGVNKRFEAQGFPGPRKFCDRALKSIVCDEQGNIWGLTRSTVVGYDNRGNLLREWGRGNGHPVLAHLYKPSAIAYDESSQTLLVANGYGGWDIHFCTKYGVCRKKIVLIGCSRVVRALAVVKNGDIFVSEIFGDSIKVGDACRSPKAP